MKRYFDDFVHGPGASRRGMKGMGSAYGWGSSNYTGGCQGTGSQFAFGGYGGADGHGFQYKECTGLGHGTCRETWISQ